MAVQLWIVGLCSAFGIKLSSSIDDVIWLAPFLTSNSSRMIIVQNSIVYTSVCMIQTLVAMAIATGGKAAVTALTGGGKNVWSTEKILTVAAGCLLAVYSVKLTYEYIQEWKEGDDREEVIQDGNMESVANNDNNGHDRKEESGALVGSDDLELQPVEGNSREIEFRSTSRQSEAQKDKDRQQTLFVVAFIGSIDDLTLFVPMLVGKGFDIVQLMLGAFVATGTIVAICIFIGQCKPIADCLSRVPLAAIVIVFAIVLLVKGFCFEDAGSL